MPALAALSPRQQRAAAAVATIRATTEELIGKCKAMVEREQDFASLDSEYVNDTDPSVLRFLLASRVEVSETQARHRLCPVTRHMSQHVLISAAAPSSRAQLRDDLLSMLVAGHETTGSVLTWTLKLLVDNPAVMAKAQAEVDRVLGDRDEVALAARARSCPRPNPPQRVRRRGFRAERAGFGARRRAQDAMQLQYLTRCINESMRLYPHPPVLIRRATEDDVLPGGYPVAKGQDIIISVYSIHHSPAVWDNAEAFNPDRFPYVSPAPPPAQPPLRNALTRCAAPARAG